MKTLKFFGLIIFSTLIGVCLASCGGDDEDDITSGSTPNKVNGHEYVDLGLSVKWATCNVGATSPDGYGNYYAWGETETKSDYSWSTLKYCGGYEGSFTKYVGLSDFVTSDSKITLDLIDDAARVNWGATWRMPTKTEQNELLNNCYWEWTTSYNGVSVNGYIVYKVKSDSDKGRMKSERSSIRPVGLYDLRDPHIFLPAAGGRGSIYFTNVGSNAAYWSSSLVEGRPQSAYGLLISDHVSSYDYRYRGKSVRPVCP